MSLSCESDPLEPQRALSFTHSPSSFIFLSLSNFLAPSLAFTLFSLDVSVMIKMFYSEKTYSSQTVTIVREIDVFEDLNIITSLIVSVSPSPRPMNLFTACLFNSWVYFG